MRSLGGGLCSRGGLPVITMRPQCSCLPRLCLLSHPDVSALGMWQLAVICVLPVPDKWVFPELCVRVHTFLNWNFSPLRGASHSFFMTTHLVSHHLIDKLLHVSSVMCPFVAELVNFVSQDQVVSPREAYWEMGPTTPGEELCCLSPERSSTPSKTFPLS